MNTIRFFSSVTLLALALLAVVTNANAVPAKRTTKTAVIDGKQVRLTLTGDENCHYWQSADLNDANGPKGVSAIDGIDSQPKYSLSADGSFQRIPDDVFLQMTRNTKKAHPATADLVKNAKAKRAKMKASATPTVMRGLVILVRFSDNDFTSTSEPKFAYKQIINGKDYKGSKNYGSVRDYFSAQSYGQMDFQFDIAGPVTLSRNIAYYGANDYNGDDVRPGTMVWEACKAVDGEIDFSDYDNDGDGEVEQIYIVYAGYGEAQGAEPYTIWPHQWAMSSAKAGGETGVGSLNFDGVTVDSYACSAELMGSSGKTMDGIGTICHEFSHCLGLPDLYTTVHSSFTMGTWSLMDYGSYLDDGYTPPGYTAFERYTCGWIDMKELTDPVTIKGMGDIETTGEAYYVSNDNPKYQEFYTLQNIQQTGWNSKAPAHGLLAIHIDYNESVWSSNSINDDSSHLRCTPICADNNRSEGSCAGDTYPGTSRNTALTDTSTPKASLYNANTDSRKLMGKPITEIAENNGLISFNFCGGTAIEAPADLAATLQAGQITAAWTPAEGAASYNLRYGVYNPEVQPKTVTLCDEDFAACYVEGKDKSADISSNLNSFLTLPGFSGYKLFQGVNGLKMSSSSYNGYLISPKLKSAGGNVTVTVQAQPYSADKNVQLYISILDENGGTVLRKEFVEGLTEPLVLETQAPETFTVRIDAEKRLYLQHLTIVGTEEDESAGERTITGIASSPYTFTPELQAARYWIAAQSVNPDGAVSPWTDKVPVAAPTLPGDANDDSKLDILDIVRITSYITDPATPISPAADINADGVIDRQDIDEILKRILGE